MTKNRNKLAYLFALASVLCWSTVATAFKLVLRSLDVATLVLFSTLTSAIVLTAIVFAGNRRKGLLTLQWNDVATSAVMGLLNPFLYYLVLFRAYDLLPAQEAQSLNYTWPIVLTLMASLFSAQKLRVFDVSAMVLSFTGVILIATRGDIGGLGFTNPEGVALALGSSVIWASYWILNMRSSLDPIVQLSLNFIFGSIYIATFVFVQGTDSAITLAGVAGAVYIGLFEMGLTFVLWINALRHARSTATVSNLVYLSPFLSLIIIALVLSETIYSSTFIGLVLIVSGILLQQRGRTEAK